jgi:hypothetical protein
MLAITRVSEIWIGIACAGIVLAGTDLGGAQRRLAASLADRAADIAEGFTRMLVVGGRMSGTCEPSDASLCAGPSRSTR